MICLNPQNESSNISKFIFEVRVYNQVMLLYWEGLQKKEHDILLVLEDRIRQKEFRKEKLLLNKVNP